MQPGQEKKLRRYLKISLGLHAAFFLFVFLAQWISPPSAELFTPTVQIDMVALPDLVKSQEKQVLDTTLPVKDAPPPPAAKKEEEVAEPAPAPEPEADRKEEMALQREKEAEREAKKALERLRSQVKKNQQEENKKKREELVNQRQEDLKRFEEAYRSAIRGNQTNQGTSATGAMQATLNAYSGHISEKLKNQWALPVWLQSKGLRAVVRIYIDSRGNIVRYHFVQSSGNEVFDDYVKGAVQRASPFAPPPEEMSRALRNSGIEVMFPL